MAAYRCKSCAKKEEEKVQINVCSGLGERGGAAPYSRGREQHLQVKKKLELFYQGFSMSNSQRLILHNSTLTPLIEGLATIQNLHHHLQFRIL